jgi:hypothetical protein
MHGFLMIVSAKHEVDTICANAPSTLRVSLSPCRPDSSPFTGL